MNRVGVEPSIDCIFELDFEVQEHMPLETIELRERIVGRIAELAKEFARLREEPGRNSSISTLLSPERTPSSEVRTRPGADLPPDAS